MVGRENGDKDDGVNSFKAQNFYYAGRTDEAVEILRTTVIIDPSLFLAHYFLGQIYRERSMAQESLAEFEKAFELSGGYPLIAARLILIYHGLGRTAEAEKLEKRLRDRAQTEYISPMSFFILHLRRKELEQAAGCLENARTERDGFLPWFLVHPSPEMRLIFDLPIFNDILKKYGLR